MKFHRTTVALSAAAVVIFGLVPATEAMAEPAIAGSGVIPLLRVGLSTPFASLDQTKTYDAPDITDLSLETLMKLGPHGQVEPNLATSVSEPNPVTYIYHLRPGIKFWDGSEMTAADVAYSWNYNRATGSTAADSFTSVKTIRASGRDTVVVTLAHPDASWQYTPALNTSEVFEMNFALAHKGNYGKPGVLVMGSGPWEIDSFDPTTGAELSANPQWWGGTVPIQHISSKFFQTDTSLALAMRAGEIDFDFSVLGAQRSFATTSGAKLVSTPSCDNGILSMNTQVGPWSDVHIRRAVAYALNRADLITANGGYAIPVYTLIPPQSLETIASTAQVDALLKSVPLYQYNLAKAKAEMLQSAYPHGFTATLPEYSGRTAINISQVIAAELQKIGITLQVKVDPNWDSVEDLAPAAKRSTTFSVPAASTRIRALYPILSSAVPMFKSVGTISPTTTRLRSTN